MSFLFLHFLRNQLSSEFMDPLWYRQIILFFRAWRFRICSDLVFHFADGQHPWLWFLVFTGLQMYSWAHIARALSKLTHSLCKQLRLFDASYLFELRFFPLLLCSCVIIFPVLLPGTGNRWTKTWANAIWILWTSSPGCWKHLVWDTWCICRGQFSQGENLPADCYSYMHTFKSRISTKFYNQNLLDALFNEVELSILLSFRSGSSFWTKGLKWIFHTVWKPHGPLPYPL